MSDDFYYYQAKYKGYRSRAAFKLLEIDMKFRIFRKGQTVVDLGAAPGGWTQIAAKKVGKAGRVMAIDRAYIPPLQLSNVEIVNMDVFSDKIFTLLENVKPIDVILSDCAPNVSGNWTIDHSTQIMLAFRALEIAKKALKKEGIFVCKVFQGSEFNEFVSAVKKFFTQTKLYKPKASRKKSAEIYIIAQNLKEQFNNSSKENESSSNANE
ncbi:MAG: RlmE family RNA methyltransferase [Candidatus Heimdallarchaeaceae archaeon]